jgi:hypothetical protein
LGRIEAGADFEYPQIHAPRQIQIPLPPRK